MSNNAIKISIATDLDFTEIGVLMADVYASLDGFASPKEQPAYYEMLANIGDFAEKDSVDILMAKKGADILGAVVYINNLKDYGAAIDLSDEIQSAAFRLLAVSNKARGLGIGKLLSQACLDRAKSAGLKQMIIHTTDSMKVAWGMYEKMGFKRSEDLDFLQSGLQVYGFRLHF